MVEAAGRLLLIDCGFSLAETRRRLARLGVTLDDLDALLITHEHGDHCRGALQLAQRTGIPLLATPGTARGLPVGSIKLEDCNFQPLQTGDWFHLDPELAILPVAVSHDAREPSQFVIEGDGCRFGILTDLGEITPTVAEAYAQCDVLWLEANHDLESLLAGPYHERLKQRVAGALGHLNNVQVADFVARELNQQRLQHLVLCHLSETNNSPALALAAVSQALAFGQQRIRIADQENGLDWIEVSRPVI